MTEKAKKKLSNAIFQCAWTIGEAYSIRAVCDSDIKPWFKWNLVAALSLTVISDIEKGMRAIDEFASEITDAKTEPEIVTTTEEES